MPPRSLIHCSLPQTLSFSVSFHSLLPPLLLILSQLLFHRFFCLSVCCTLVYMYSCIYKHKHARAHVSTREGCQHGDCTQDPGDQWTLFSQAPSENKNEAQWTVVAAKTYCHEHVYQKVPNTGLIPRSQINKVILHHH